MLVKEERLHLQTIKHLVDTINFNDEEILRLYKESKVMHDADWGTLAWGPLPDWEQIRIRTPSPLLPSH